MTTLPIPSGPTNREIIDRAWQVVGTADAMFGRTPEEYASGVLVLGGMMLEWPYSLLGFDVEDAAGLRVEQESGIERKWLDAVAHGLAERIAPMIGKTLSPHAMKTKAILYSRLCALEEIPAFKHAAGTIRGAGSRWTRNPFFPVVTRDEEEAAQVVVQPFDIDALPEAP